MYVNAEYFYRKLYLMEIFSCIHSFLNKIFKYISSLICVVIILTKHKIYDIFMVLILNFSNYSENRCFLRVLFIILFYSIRKFHRRRMDCQPVLMNIKKMSFLYCSKENLNLCLIKRSHYDLAINCIIF